MKAASFLTPLHGNGKSRQQILKPLSCLSASPPPHSCSPGSKKLLLVECVDGNNIWQQQPVLSATTRDGQRHQRMVWVLFCFVQGVYSTYLFWGAGESTRVRAAILDVPRCKFVLVRPLSEYVLGAHLNIKLSVSHPPGKRFLRQYVYSPDLFMQFESTLVNES